MESPKLDTTAIEMYSQLVMEVEQDGYPADYNLFEWLGNAIRKVAPHIMAGLRGAARGFLRNGPIGAFAGGLHGAADSILGRTGGNKAPRQVEFVEN
jgi:hypothetical protein